MDGLFDNGSTEGLVNPILETTTPATEQVQEEEVTQEETVEETVEETTEETTEETVEQPTNTQVHEQESDIQNYLSDIMNKLDNIQQTQEPPKEEVVEEKTQEELTSDFMDKFYENPIESIKKIQEDAIKPFKDYIEGIQTQQHWKNVAQKFEQEHSDLDMHRENMKQILSENPILQNSPNPYELAYNISKGMMYKEPPKIDNVVSSEDGLNAILQNKELVSKIVQNYMSNKDTPPPTIGSQQGTPVLTDTNTPKSLSDGTKAWLSTHQ